MNDALDQVLLQKPPMRMVDTIIEVNDKKAVCSFTVTKDNIFFHHKLNGMLYTTGIEMMAQTAAVYIYHSEKEKESSHEQQIGFLTSVRQYDSELNILPLGATLVMKANNTFIDTNAAVFDCSIEINNKTIASGILSAYQPDANELTKILED